MRAYPMRFGANRKIFSFSVSIESCSMWPFGCGDSDGAVAAADLLDLAPDILTVDCLEKVKAPRYLMKLWLLWWTNKTSSVSPGNPVEEEALMIVES